LVVFIILLFIESLTLTFHSISTENKILLTPVESIGTTAPGSRSRVYSLQEFCSSLCHYMVSFCLAASSGSKVEGGERLVVSGVPPFLSSSSRFI